MNVNSVSNASSGYSVNTMNKGVKNSPSFGALRADAADVFIKAAQGLDQKSQNVVLEQLIKFADRAKQSKVLDLGACNKTLEFADKVYNETSNAIPGTIKNIEKNNADKILVQIDANNSSAVDSLTKLGFQKNFNHLSTPLDKFFEILTSLFDKEEARIVDQIETDKVTKALTEQLNNLIVKTK